MIAWFAKNHVAANLLMITILLMGVFSLKSNIPVEIFPSFASEVVEVKISLRGSTPEDAELGLAIKVEEAVQDLQGIDKITSTSVEGSSTIRIEADSGYDVRELLADVKSRVDAINTFPADVENPKVSVRQYTRDVISVTVSSIYSEREIREFAEKVRDDLLNLPEITQLSLDGVRSYEIIIEVKQDKLKQYNLLISDILSAVRDSSQDVSAGNVRTEGGDVLIRSKGQAYTREQYENIVIKTNTDGSSLRLIDIATVNDGFGERPLRARFNGEQGALIDIYRIGNQNVIDIAAAARQYIDDRQDTLPVGFKLGYWDDDSEIVKSRLNTLISNAIQGGILILILLTLFLRPSIAFWVFIGIPISFMGAFILMPLIGVTINVMSLFGFILVLGIVVDDAIVTGENIYRHTHTAKSGLEAAIEGTREVAGPVTFGVLTTVAAFLPLAFIDGRRGAIFAQIPAIVIPVLIFSLIESKFVLPSHLKHLRLRGDKSKPSKFSAWQQRFADGFEGLILTYYQPLLKKAITNKLTTLSLFTGIFILIFAFISSGWTKFVFFPRIPSETAKATLTMPVGTSFDVVDGYVIKMSNAAKTLQEKYRNEEGDSLILNTLAITKNESGRVYFEIVPADKNTSGIGSRQLVNEWRELIGELPGAESLTYRAELGRSGSPIDFQLMGNDFNELKDVANQIKEKLATYPSVFEISDTLSTGKEELQIVLNAQGYAMGLSSSSVTRQVRGAFFGTEIERIQRGRDDVLVSIKFPRSERESVSSLSDMLIETPQGGQVPLSHIASLVPGKSPAAIKRIDRYRSVNVTADVDKKVTNMTVLNADLRPYVKELVASYPNVRLVVEGEAKEQSEAAGSLAWGLTFVFFIIYCLLAIPFRSYAQPIIVMSIIPFGIIGAIVGHWIMRMDLTIFSVLGMMALIGVVVNDSLVLVDFINKKRQAGVELMEAVLIAGQSRFRPVMLTSLTTFFGLMPLLFEKSTQAQFLIPMATSLSFGILFATFITLILVPVNYLIIDKLSHKVVMIKQTLFIKS